MEGFVMEEKKLLGESLTIAPGVIETIVSMAVSQVKGVAQVGRMPISSSIFSAFSKKRPTPGILILADDDDQIVIDVHISVYYGYRLQELGEQVRFAVAETLTGQLGISVAKVNIYIDDVRFPE